VAAQVVDFYLNIKGDAEQKLSGLVRVTPQAIAGLRGVETAAKSTNNGLSQLREGTEKLRLERVSRALGVLQGGMVALSNPLTAAVVGVGALATAGVAGAFALGKLVFSTKQWHDELVATGRAGDLLSPAQIASVEGMDSALSELGVSLKRAAVLIGADFAPAVERAAGSLGRLLAASEDVIQKVDWTKVLGAITSGWSDVAIKIGDAASELERYGRAGKGGGNRAASTEFGAGFGSRPMSEAVGGGMDVSGIAATAVAAGKAAQASADKARAAAAADAERTRKTIEEVGAYWGKLEVEAALRAADAAEAQWRIAQSSAAALTAIATSQERFEKGQAARSVGIAKMLLDTAAGLREKARQFLDYIFDLPGAVGKSIEGLLTKLIPRFIERLPQLFAALFDLPFAIMRGIVNAIPAIANAFVKVIGDAIANIGNFFRGGEDNKLLTGRRGKTLGTSFERGRFSLLGFFNKDDRDAGVSGERGGRSRQQQMSFGGSRLTGGFISRTGQYLLHAGERVVPPTGASTSAAMSAMRGGKGGGVTINVNGALVGTVRDLARMIRRELGDYGTGASLTPRGV
jgi:hypothetical protein